MKEEMLCKVSLGDVIQPRRQKVLPSAYPELPYIGLEHIEAHSMKLLGTGCSSEMNSAANRFFKGDVLYSRLRPYLNKVFKADLDGLCSAEFIVFPDCEGIDSTFLALLLNSAEFVAFANSLNAGDRPRVDFDQISSFKFLLPSSLAQRAIVAKLEELLSDLDAGVAELKAAQKKLVQYRQSLLKAAVEGALTAGWREERKKEELRRQKADTDFLPSSFDASSLLQRILTERRARWEAKQLAKFKDQGKTPPKDWQKKYPEPVQPDTTDLPELPEEWIWATLSQVGWLDRGRSKHRPRNAPHLYGGPYPFVQTGDIRHSETFISNVEATYSEAGLEQSRLWPVGTMCITIAANIGKTAILSMEACFPDSVVGFLPGADEVSVRYVEYFMRSIQQKLEDEAPATAQKNINLEILEKVVIPITPTEEQVQIVNILDGSLAVARENDRSIELGLKQSNAQRQNILRAAFAGQLVPQDPNDEPASVLLERIRAERAAKSVTKKVRSKIPKE